jgi:hypothetical protein
MEAGNGACDLLKPTVPLYCIYVYEEKKSFITRQKRMNFLSFLLRKILQAAVKIIETLDS